jgi:Fuc2NAc and GlcNAc transferase
MMFILSGFLFGFAGSWVVMKYGDKIGVIDIPNSRSSHHKATFKGAGLGILTALVFFSLVLEIPFFVWLPALAISMASYWGADKHIMKRLFDFG